MIITSTKKKKPNKIDNIQKIIDSAGTTQFKNIYKNLQTEIKDKIITKLLSKLDIQNKQIEEYKQEIISLKNDLVYLLKRVILSKNEEKNNSINAKTNKNDNKYINNYSISNKNYKTSTNSPLNNSTHINFYNQTENNVINYNKLSSLDISNIYPINNNQSELDIKINNYINSIYKHNFAKNETNINDYYSLNKTENLYDEIFQKKSNNKKKGELYMGTEPCISKKKQIHNNRSQRNIHSSLKKRPNASVDEGKKNKKQSSSMVNIKKNNNDYIKDYKNNELEEKQNNSDNMEVNNKNLYKNKGKMNIIIKNNNYGNKFLKVRKKSDELNTMNNKLNHSKSFKNKTQPNDFYSVTNANKTNHNTTLKKKIRRNNHYIPINRSPFLVNKF